MESAGDVRIRFALEPDLPALVRLLGVLFALEADFAPDEARQRALAPTTPR